MFNEEINSILERLGGYGVQKYIIKPSDPMRAPRLENYSPGLQNLQWYANQRSIIECLHCDFFEDLSACITSYYSEDSQFPPDIVKSCRLYSLMQEFNPSGILEIGCGTSSLVISKYINDNDVKPSAMCVDASKDWIYLTKSKIEKVSMVNVNKIEWVEWSDDKNALVNNFAKKTDKLFVYLDARLTADDQLEGMGDLLRILEGFSGDLAVLIDARLKAVLTLNGLASSLKSNLAVASNCLVPTKEEVGSAFHRYQHMGSFTYVNTFPKV